MGGAIESDKSEPSSSAAVQAIDQPRVDVLLINKSNELYRVLVTTVLTIVEEELSLRKLAPLIQLQKKNGLRVSESKANKHTAREMVAILAEVVSELVAEKVKESQFMSVGSDGSEARKTRDEKEMVYGKVVCRGDFGVKTPVFLLACKALKDFGGANADGVFSLQSSS